VASCSLLFDATGEQCTRDADCAARGGAFASMRCENRVCVASGLDGASEAAPPVDASDAADAAPVDPVWGCLGNVKASPSTNPKVTVRVPLLDLLTKGPVTDVKAALCAKIDVNCATPLGVSQPGADGVLNLTLDSGFDGYVVVTPVLPDAGAGAGDAAADEAGADAALGDGGLDLAALHVPALVFFNPPIVEDRTYINIMLLTGHAITALVAANGYALDPTLGAVFMDAVDCAQKPVSDVAVTLDVTTPTTHGFYFVGGIPSLTAGATDATGYTGFINVTPGARTVTAQVKSQQRAIGRVSVFAKPGFISYTAMAPSP
jgi:hypothetical protein